MAKFTFSDSQYKFTEPVRYFKANDPYYFEVDNIPIKQLQENCLWLRDQLRKLGGGRRVGPETGGPPSTNTNGGDNRGPIDRPTAGTLEITRKDIDELRPFATGGDRVVRVRPGRYSARINDIGNEPLQYLLKIVGQELQDTEIYKTYNLNSTNDNFNTLVINSLNKLKQTVASSALHMNGLAERAFTWAARDIDTPTDYAGLTTDALEYAGIGGVGLLGPFVYSQVLLWYKDSVNTDGFYVLPTNHPTSLAIGFAKLPTLENHLIKRWRGVARTAIVDVPEELSIEVPSFSQQDFFYTDENGDKQFLNATHRIDMVFIYSKPVDASGVSILQNGTVTQITSPTLGIVRGAGIGMNFQPKTSAQYTPESALDSGGNPMILGSVADQSADNIGFLQSSGTEQSFTVKGSFPSPDDLLNLSPLLSQDLEDNAIELVGQSILPVAYIFVDGDSQEIAGTRVIAQEDVIDIRPLLRTTELTYNERAGLAAAVPQISLANPVVGKSVLDKELKRVTEFVTTKISEIQTSTQVQDLNNGKLLATGYVFGGLNYGTEGALFHYYKQKFASDNEPTNDSDVYIRNYIQSRYGYGNFDTGLLDFPTYPDWDISRWCLDGNFENKGVYPNDRITPVISHQATPSNLNGADLFIKSGSYREAVNSAGTTLAGGVPNRVNNFTNTEISQTGSGDNEMGQHKVNFMYISKRILFNRPSWMLDYHVDAEFLNSIGLTYRGSGLNNPNSQDLAGYTGIWVEKGFNEFTIYVGFVTVDHMKNTGVTQDLLPHRNRDSQRFASFLVPVRDILYSEPTAVPTCGAGFLGNVKVGKCTYPTIKWRMVGISQNSASYHYANLNSSNPLISLNGA